jgi:prepilin-type N-terminal cleavage/methylation domain-containing protein
MPTAIAIPGRAARRSAHRGFSLVEMLVAALILSVALTGLLATWLYMTRSAITTDDRAAAYECARLVLERARVNGFSITRPPSQSSPASSNSRSNWISPNILRNRFYDAHLEELGNGDDNTKPQSPPTGARFAVTTLVSYSPDSSRPTGREDLRLMTVAVTVRGVDENGVVGDILAEGQTCLTEGGT